MNLKICVPRAVPLLIENLKYERDYETVAQALGKIKDRRAAEALIRMFGYTDRRKLRPGDNGLHYTKFDSNTSRLIAARALAEMGELQWLDIIKGDNEDIRRLGETNDPRVVEPLIMILNDAENLRREAAKALGMLKDPRAVEPLIKALDAQMFKDYEFSCGYVDAPSVQAEAARALGRLKDLRAVDPLLEHLSKKPGKDYIILRTAIADALGEIGEARAIEPLRKLLDDENEKVREAAAAALTRLG